MSHEIAEIRRGGDRRRHAICADGELLASAHRGFRDPAFRVGTRLTDGQLDALNAAIRDDVRGRRERAAEAATARAAALEAGGRISALATRHDGSIELCLDGAPALVIGPDSIALAGLRVGMAIDPAAAGRLREITEADAAVIIVDRLLAERDRSEGEIAKKLSAKGFTAPVIAAAIARRAAYVSSDADFATRFAPAWTRAGGKAPGAAYAKLRELGVAAEVAREVTAEAASPEDLDAAAARAARGIDLADRRSVERYLRRMASRGWSYGDAKSALDRLRAGDLRAGDLRAGDAAVELPPDD